MNTPQAIPVHRPEHPRPARCDVRILACLALVALLCGCTDGATRIAYDIEAGVGAFRRSNAATYTIRHAPERIPDGCGEAYTVQFSANSSLLIWCKRSGDGQVTASHATTYHLRFVKVPRTFKLDKAAGEATLIDLAKKDGDIIVTGVR
ncbi:MAG: hypothetical protein IT530_11020 [Burkholderiales bacterium]|nr:hypothetical protein [Burkholderiales bacterium]